MLWIFQNLYEHIKGRGRRDTPLGLLIDEFAALTQKVTADENPLAVLLDEFIQQYMRNHRIFFSAAFQSLLQVDEQLRNTLLSLGTIVVGRVATIQEARLLADTLIKKDVFRVKYWHRVWGRGSEPPFGLGLRGTESPYYIIDYDPEFMGLSDQLELASRRLMELPLFRFLARAALREGEVSEEVIRLPIGTVDQDPKTGEYIVPDLDLVAAVQHGLAKRTGRPASDIRKEIDSRLSENEGAKPKDARERRVVSASDSQPSADKGGEGRALPDGAKNPPPEEPGQPALSEREHAFLAFLIDHPETMVSVAYKSLCLSWRAGNELRDSLIQRGYVAEIEIRAGKVGRPTKVFLPTFKAFSLLGKEPPSGRGGVIHRYLQRMVAEGAAAKGYRTRLEYQLGNGGIVDVHLEKVGEKVAVEIAVISSPEREISHIKQCLNAGYDRVFAIFADGALLRKTQDALPQIFSAEELGRVRLLPLNKLSGIG